MSPRPHDPYRSGYRSTAPQLDGGRADRPVTVLAHVDRYPPAVNAGAEWMLHPMLRHLAARGHRAIVTTAVPQRTDFEGVEVWPAEEAETLAAGADVLVGHLLWTNEQFGLASRHRLPFLYLVHNDSQVAYWRVEERLVTALVYNSRWIEAAHVAGRAGRPPWRGHGVVVRPPTLLADYALDRDPAENRFVTFVNPIPDKGGLLVLELTRLLPSHRFLVVEGAYGAPVRALRRQPNVTWQAQTGRMRDDVYARTRVLLAPSVYESWGRVATEALASGIPVLAHPTDGLVEACADAAIYLDRSAPQLWARQIEALDEPGTHARWSARARGRAAELDRAAVDDLDRWEDLVLRAAAAPRRTLAGSAP